MGLLSLLLLPLTGPAKGFLFVAEQIAREAERALYDEGGIRAALLELELRLQEGLISEEEHSVAEEELMGRLADALERRQAPPREEV